MKTSNLESFLHENNPSKTREARLILSMSLPAILAQLTSIAMQYIDAAMVGRLGASATGAIGLVTSTTWLTNGMCIGMTTGFSVQVAQLVGADRKDEAGSVFRQSLKVLFLCALVLMSVCFGISGYLPRFLGADEALWIPASTYFFIYACSIPFAQMRQLSAAMLQCTGDMKTPSIMAAMVCLLDVVFNFFLIPSYGVKGAALGTAFAEVVISLTILSYVCLKSPVLNLKQRGSWKLVRKTVVTAVKIAVPMTLDHVFLCSAYIAGTFLIAPLGTIAVASNSLAITAESLCYMPGYGIGAASTAIIGQTIGAGRRDLTKSFSRLTVLLSMVLMGTGGIVMFFACPYVFSMLTSDSTVAALSVSVLRMELFAEPLYGASICCSGVFRGAGDTLFPSIMNLVSMWGVRILLAFFLIPVYGLHGYWIAMTAELCFRGIIFLARLKFGGWMKKALI